MKQCPNPNCVIYTRLDELPDTYLRCPQCDQPLVDAPMLTGALTSSLLSEESTSPYTPYVPAPAPSAPPRRYVQQALPAEDPYSPYAEDEEDPEEADEDALEEALPPSRTLPGLRTIVTLGVVAALLMACIAVTMLVSSHFFPQSPAVSGPLATQTVLSSYRPAVNTPVSILPTISLSGIGDAGGAPIPTLPVSSAPLPTAPAASSAPAPPPSSALGPAPVLDALMCARLEGGQPVGPATVYKPADPFNLAVQASYGPGGAQTVLTRWYGPGGAAIYDLRQNYSQQGTYYAGFTLNRKDPWPAGDYRVDIYTNNSPQPVQSVSFSVQP